MQIGKESANIFRQLYLMVKGYIDVLEDDRVHSGCWEIGNTEERLSVSSFDPNFIGIELADCPVRQVLHGCGSVEGSPSSKNGSSMNS